MKLVEDGESFSWTAQLRGNVVLAELIKKRGVTTTALDKIEIGYRKSKHRTEQLNHLMLSLENQFQALEPNQRMIIIQYSINRCIGNIANLDNFLKQVEKALPRLLYAADMVASKENPFTSTFKQFIIAAEWKLQFFIDVSLLTLLWLMIA
jgi:hypothetical protein